MSTIHPPTSDDLAGASRHFAGVSFNGALSASLAALGLVCLAVVVGAYAVVSSAMTGSIHEGQPKALIDDLVTKHTEKSNEYITRFDERYIFFKPPPKPLPRPVVVDTPAPPPPPPVDTTPKAPTTYQGPSIAWVIGEDVYFNLVPATATEKYMRLRVGDERNGVKVLSTEKLPRTVRVAHMGGEYDVKVFGDGMASNSLFPTTPRPSILVPGFVPAGEPIPPSAETTPAAGETEVVDGEEVEAGNAVQLHAAPADGRERPRTDSRSRGRNSRGDGRGRPQRPSEDPGGGDGKLTERQAAPIESSAVTPTQAR